MCGSRQPAPITSQALSAAAAISGSPAGMPVASLASRRDLAQRARGGHEVDQLVRRHGHGLPFPVARPGPVQLLVVEGHVADLAADRVDEPPGQPVGQVAGEKQVLVRAFPDVGLVRANPVRLGLGLQIGDGLASCPTSRNAAPTARRPASGRRCGAGPARRSPGAAAVPSRSTLTTVDALGGERDAGDPLLEVGRLAGGFGLPPELLARLAQRGPVVIGVAARPSRAAARHRARARRGTCSKRLPCRSKSRARRLCVPLSIARRRSFMLRAYLLRHAQWPRPTRTPAPAIAPEAMPPRCQYLRRALTHRADAYGRPGASPMPPAAGVPPVGDRAAGRADCSGSATAARSASTSAFQRAVVPAQLRRGKSRRRGPGCALPPWGSSKPEPRCGAAAGRPGGRRLPARAAQRSSAQSAAAPGIAFQLARPCRSDQAGRVRRRTGRAGGGARARRGRQRPSGTFTGLNTGIRPLGSRISGRRFRSRLEHVERDAAECRQLAAGHGEQARLLPDDVIARLLRRVGLARADDRAHAGVRADRRRPGSASSDGNCDSTAAIEIGDLVGRDGRLVVHAVVVVDVGRADERDAFPREDEDGPAVDRVEKAERLR